MKEKIIHFLKAKGYYVVLAAAVLTVGAISLLSYRASQKEIAEKPLTDQSQDVEKVEENVPDERDDAKEQSEGSGEGTPAPQAQPLEYQAPLQGELIAHFSPDQPVYSYTLKDWRVHNGIDIAAKAGTAVANVAAGMVESAEADDLLGNLVIVRHTDGKVSRYASLDEIKVKEGQVLQKGDTIGTVGSTMLLECGETAHLHYELWSEDQPTDPTFLMENS